MIMIFKKLFVPSGTKTELTAIETYSVRWYSPQGSDQKKECEFFISAIEAKEFAKQLKEAFKLIKANDWFSEKVSVEKT